MFDTRMNMHGEWDLWINTAFQKNKPTLSTPITTTLTPHHTTLQIMEIWVLKYLGGIMPEANRWNFDTNWVPTPYDASQIT